MSKVIYSTNMNAACSSIVEVMSCGAYKLTCYVKCYTHDGGFFLKKVAYHLYTPFSKNKAISAADSWATGNVTIK